MAVRDITKGLRFPEGPVVLPDGDVLVVEVMGGALTRVKPDGSKTVVADLGGGPNGAAMGPDGRCYVCNSGGLGPAISEDVMVPSDAPLDTPPGSIQTVDVSTGAFETVYASTDATPFWAPNDIVFDADGGFWFTDFGRNRERVRTRGAVYYAKTDGSHIEEAIFGVETPNGIGLSPDGGTLYVADTFTSYLWAFPLKAPGQVDWSKGRPPMEGKILGRGKVGQFLDSLAVDSAGNICVASCGGGAILVFSPEGGVSEEVVTSDLLTTNIAFGGPDLKTAFVTLSSSGRLVAMDWSVSGLKLNCC
jgi:gluconolactonase